MFLNLESDYGKVVDHVVIQITLILVILINIMGSLNDAFQTIYFQNYLLYYLNIT